MEDLGILTAFMGIDMPKAEGIKRVVLFRKSVLSLSEAQSYKEEFLARNEEFKESAVTFEWQPYSVYV